MKTTVLDFVGQSHNSDGLECVNHYQHRCALRRQYTSPAGRAIRAMAEGWELYALQFSDRYDTTISTDGVLGEYWLDLGESIRRLLDGDCGGWDCGSINANIVRIMKENGFPREDL